MNISFLAYGYGSNVSYDTIARVFLPTVPTFPTFPTIARVFLPTPTVPTFPTIARVDKFSCLRTYGSNVSYVSYDSSRWSK